MVMAVVLVNVSAEKTEEVATALVNIPGVSEVFSVAGNYDLVALLRVSDNELLADLVTTRIRKVAGITRTETLIGFRAYSQRELATLMED
jgi:DNA-binding Lrp family transcriptional regulator